MSRNLVPKNKQQSHLLSEQADLLGYTVAMGYHRSMWTILSTGWMVEEGNLSAILNIIYIPNNLLEHILAPNKTISISFNSSS